MEINKKLLVILFLILIVITICIAKSYFEYSLEEFANLFDKSNEIPKNIYIKVEYIEERWELYENQAYEIYAKDDIIYTKEKYSETIHNYKNKSVTDIYCSDETKKIIESPIQGNGRRNPLTEILIGLSRELKSTQGKYKYCRKEEFNGKKCIKCSITQGKVQYIYYVDIKDNTVAKIEIYSNGGLLRTILYTYSYGTVTDDDILNFDINNYPDYEYEKWDS